MAEEQVIAKVWYFESKSSKKVPKPRYETLLYTDDTTSCGCKGWCMKKAGQERSCRHTRLVDSGQADDMSDEMHDYTKKKKRKTHQVETKIIKGAARSEIANRLANIG